MMPTENTRQTYRQQVKLMKCKERTREFCTVSRLRYEEQNEVRECLLSFGAECFVFQFAIQKHKNLDIQNSNFSCCFVWV
jgi:hypothetical protein